MTDQGAEYPKIYGPFQRNNETNRVKPGHWITDELNILRSVMWTFTEKIDGTNVRVIWDGHAVRCAGRTDRAVLHPDLLKQLETLFPEEKMEERWGEAPATLYGEGFGAGINGGGDYTQEKDFILFDVLNEIWRSPYEVADIGHSLGVKHVKPWQVTLNQGIDMVAQGLRSQYKDGFAEGIVGRPVGGLLDRRGRRIAVKLKHVDLHGIDWTSWR